MEISEVYKIEHLKWNTTGGQKINPIGGIEAVNKAISYSLIGAAILIMFIPIILNFIINTDPICQVAQNNDWIGFWGNYAGGLLGGIFAFLIAWVQINKTIKEGRELDKKSNRSFIIAEEFNGSYDLKDVNTNPNSRLILNKYYEEFKPDKMPERIQFYKIQIVGQPEIILNFVFTITIRDFDNPQNEYTITSHLGAVTKNEELFIPIANLRYRVISINRVEISYTTIKGENLIYEHNYQDRLMYFYTVDKDGCKVRLFEPTPIEASSWTFPNKRLVNTRDVP